MSATDVFTTAQDSQAVALAYALTQMQSSSGSNALSEFSAAQRASLINTVMEEHSDTAAYNLGNLTRSQDALDNIMYYHARNKDVDDIQKQILGRATTDAQGSVTDANNAKRQFEINEWTASNKAETLFLMQLLLIAITFTIFMLFLNRMGVVPTAVFSLVTGIVVFAVIITFIVRYIYTSRDRDGRYWNRKQYGHPNEPKIAATCPDVSGNTFGDKFLTGVGTGLDRLSTGIFGTAPGIVGSNTYRL
jgi:hypothetical protein